MNRVLPALVLAAVGLGACTGAETAVPATGAGAAKETQPVMPQTPNPVPAAVMERLYEEVAEKSGMARDALVLVRAEKATWSDSSLGCPQPNVDYAQMIVQGYWVILRAGREEYDYRVDHNQRHRRCTGATKRAPIVYPPDS